METQLKSFYYTPKGIHFVTIFGYSTKGIPGLEINGLGKVSKNIKEKLIFLARHRKLEIPMRRFVICADINELEDSGVDHLKWLEFPMLLIYLYLSGLVPISDLSDCLSSGWINTSGDVFHMPIKSQFDNEVYKNLSSYAGEELKLIHSGSFVQSEFSLIESHLLLEHIPKLKFFKKERGVLNRNIQVS